MPKRTKSSDYLPQLTKHVSTKLWQFPRVGIPVLPKENSSTTRVILEFSCGGTGVGPQDAMCQTTDVRPDTTASALFFTARSYPDDNQADKHQRQHRTGRDKGKPEFFKEDPFVINFFLKVST